MTLPALRALLEGIVDYAGLFAPAKLDMAATTENYARYLVGDHAWMLGRLIVPVSRFDEFVAVTGDVEGADRWQLSAVVGKDYVDDMARIDDFNSGGSAIIDTVEVRADNPETIADIAGRASAGMSVYIEVPLTEGSGEFLRAISASRVRAKIRTGGVTPEAFPESHDVADFIRTCYGHGVAFKATAGLHHALRGEYALTYEPDSPRGMMHGFLNVFLAAAFCYNGLGGADAPRMMNVSDIAELTFDSDGAAWSDYRLSVDEIATMRRRLAISFGSCSFTEPVEHLEQLNLI